MAGEMAVEPEGGFLVDARVGHFDDRKADINDASRGKSFLGGLEAGQLMGRKINAGEGRSNDRAPSTAMILPKR